MKLSVWVRDYDGTIARGDVLDPSVRAAIASARTDGVVTVRALADELRALEDRQRQKPRPERVADSDIRTPYRLSRNP